MRVTTSLILLASLAAPARAESAWTLLDKGIQAYQKKNYERAEATLKAAIRADGRCQDAYFYLGRIAEKNRRTDEAVAYYEKIDPKWPTHSLAASRLGHIALRAGRRQDAARHFAVYAADRPTPDAWLQLATVQLDLKRYDEAEATLAKAQKLSPDNLELAEMRGRLYLETERPKPALDEYTAIVKKIPIDTSARYLRGVCLERLDRPAEAVAEWQEVLKRDPYHGLTLRRLVKRFADDPEREALVVEYRRRLEQLANSRPKVRRVKGG